MNTESMIKWNDHIQTQINRNVVKTSRDRKPECKMDVDGRGYVGKMVHDFDEETDSELKIKEGEEVKFFKYEY